MTLFASGFIHIAVPVIVSGLFIALMSLPKEPARQQLSALLVAGAGAVYLWRWVPFLGRWPSADCLHGWRSIRSKTIALPVLRGQLHVLWDILHHLYGHPILPFVPLSSEGCAICDTGIAIWYFLDAPSIWRRARHLTKIEADRVLVPL